MIKVKCVGKNRNDKGVIVNYNLVDEKGNKFQATSQQIKSEIKAGKYQFTNLQIDKAGRLVDKAEEKLAQTKVTKIPSTRKVEDKEEKKKIAKKEVKDYIEYFKEHYNDDLDGGDKLLGDLYGHGHVEYSDGELKSVCRMTDASRNYFKLMIDMIEKEALKNGIVAYRNEDEYGFSVKFPEPVEKFFESSGLGETVREALFREAAKNEKIACITFGFYYSTSTEITGYWYITGNYNNAKEFIKKVVNEEAEQRGVSPSEILLKTDYESSVDGQNMLGNVFVLKFLAEAQKRDAEYYKKQVLNGAMTTDLICDPNDMVAKVRYVLRNTEYGMTYLALKLGILPARDDWDTEEEKEREDKITAEAERLAAELVK